MKPEISLSVVRPGRVLRTLLVVIAVLAALSLLGQSVRFFLGYERALGFVPEFSVDHENNIPTYFSTVLLLGAALLLGVITHVVRRTQQAFPRHWLGLSCIFVYLSVDEFASLHERLREPVQYAFAPDGIFYFGWVIPALGLVVLFGLAYIRFFWHLPPRWKRLFLMSGGLYVGGSLGMELVGGWYVEQHGVENMTYALIATVEEVMEMSGMAVFLYTLLSYLNAHVSRIELLLGEQEAPAGVELSGSNGRVTEEMGVLSN